MRADIDTTIPDFLRRPNAKEREEMAKSKAPAEAGVGHNSGPGVVVAREQLRSIIERLERLEEEKQAIAEDIKEVYAEAKGNGFDTKIIREVIRIRKQDAAERQEREALLDVYLAALGMLADTPLGRAAIEHATA